MAEALGSSQPPYDKTTKCKDYHYNVTYYSQQTRELAYATDRTEQGSTFYIRFDRFDHHLLPTEAFKILKS